jgi:hypothetical protein
MLLNANALDRLGEAALGETSGWNTLKLNSRCGALEVPASRARVSSSLGHLPKAIRNDKRFAICKNVRRRLTAALTFPTHAFASEERRRGEVGDAPNPTSACTRSKDYSKKT